MGRPRQHNEDTARALLGAAEAIVASDGPDALSVRRVAEQAGTSTRAVYSVFDSKEGMIAALGNHAFDMIGSWVGEVVRTDDPARDLAEAAVRKFRRWALDHPGLFRITFQRAEVAPEVAARFRPAQLEALTGLVVLVSRAMGLDGGLVNPEVLEATAKFDAMCEGLALLELRGALPPDRAEQVWRDGITELITGMQSAKSANR
jgi:AcrR family transcriptional regulator